MSRYKKGNNIGALKTVIVHNTCDTDITSDVFVREMQKRENTCQRCRRIIELAIKLLQKVPVINKKAIMGICDHCKLKDPCRDCNETADNFLYNYESNKKKEAIYRKKWEKVDGDIFLDKKTVKQHKISESKLRMEELLRQEYAKAERELEISDLCLQTPGSTKSLPVISMDLRSDQPSKKKIVSDSKLTAPKEVTFTSDDIYDVLDFDSSFEKTIYSPSTARETQTLGEFASVLHASKENLDITSITTDNNMFLQTRPKQKSKYYGDDVIFPEQPRPYAHEREKELTRNEQKYIDERYIDATEKKNIEYKVKSGKIPKDDSDKEAVLEDSSKLEDIRLFLRKKPVMKPESNELETSQQEFSFLFPNEKIIKNEDIVIEKTSQELIQEIQDNKNANINRKTTKERLQKEEEREKKRLEEARLTEKELTEKDFNTGKSRQIDKNIKLSKQIKVGRIKKDVVAIEQNNNKTPKKLLPAANKILMQKDKQYNAKDAKDKITTNSKNLTSDSNRETSIVQPKKTQSDSMAMNKIELENKKTIQSQNGKMLSKEEKDKILLRKENEQEKKKMNDDKEVLKNLKFIKKQKSHKTLFKFGNENKKTQTIHQKHELVGLADMLDGKNAFKPKNIPQLDRKKESPNKKLAKKEITAINQKAKKKKDMTDIALRKVKNSLKHDILVEFKEGSGGPRYTYKGKTLREHWDIHEKCHTTFKDLECPFCLSSELELNADLRQKKHLEHTQCIKGQKIVNANKMHDSPDERNKPILFETHYEIPTFELGDNEKKLNKKSGKLITVNEGQNTTSGVIRYALSDRTFIDKGWTVLPTEKVMRKMNVYRMRPVKPEFDWFKRNREKQLMSYDSGERFAEYEEDGSCHWYYRNQRLALDYYDAEELNAQQRYVIYSNGEPDERGRSRPYTVLATFDHLGNGVVFDHGGKIRLKYNQTEGVLLDRSIGPTSHWQWHTLNDPPELQQVMIDTQLTRKDPNILEIGTSLEENLNQPYDLGKEEMLAIEYENVVKEKSKKLKQNFKPFQIRMKALKINEHFSLKILDQANIFLIYRDGTTNIKLNIGMLLDHKEIVDTDTAEVGEVVNNLERLPARTGSLAAMQGTVMRAQRFETNRVERERKLRLPAPCASADKLTAAVSRPIRIPLRAINSSTTATTHSPCCLMNRKLSSNNVYYSTT